MEINGNEEENKMSFNYTRKNAYDYDSVKKAQADLNANSTYNKSSAVLAAERLKRSMKPTSLPIGRAGHTAKR